MAEEVSTPWTSERGSHAPSARFRTETQQWGRHAEVGAGRNGERSVRGTRHHHLLNRTRRRVAGSTSPPRRSHRARGQGSVATAQRRGTDAHPLLRAQGSSALTLPSRRVSRWETSRDALPDERCWWTLGTEVRTLRNGEQTMKVRVTVTVDVDEQSWAHEYGIAESEVREDVLASIKTLIHDDFSATFYREVTFR